MAVVLSMQGRSVVLIWWANSRCKCTACRGSDVYKSRTFAANQLWTIFDQRIRQFQCVLIGNISAILLGNFRGLLGGLYFGFHSPHLAIQSVLRSYVGADLSRILTYLSRSRKTQSWDCWECSQAVQGLFPEHLTFNLLQR